MAGKLTYGTARAIVPSVYRIAVGAMLYLTNNGSLAFLAAALVAGCASQTLTATPNSISIEYNRNLTDHMTVVSEANQHCSKYGKVASLTDTTISPRGNWYTRTFRCE